MAKDNIWFLIKLYFFLDFWHISPNRMKCIFYNSGPEDPQGSLRGLQGVPQQNDGLLWEFIFISPRGSIKSIWGSEGVMSYTVWEPKQLKHCPKTKWHFSFTKCTETETLKAVKTAHLQLVTLQHVLLWNITWGVFIIIISIIYINTHWGACVRAA